MCVSKVSSGSNITPKLVTEEDRGMVWPEKVMLVIGVELI